MLLELLWRLWYRTLSMHFHHKIRCLSSTMLATLGKQWDGVQHSKDGTPFVLEK